MTPQEIGKQLFEEQVVNNQNTAPLIHRLSTALKATQTKNQSLNKEYEKQQILVERLKLALKQQLSTDKTQTISSRIQEQQINQLVRDLNKTEILIEEIKHRYIQSVKKNKKKTLKSKIINYLLASAFVAALWPIYLYQQQNTTIQTYKNKISLLENDLTLAQSLASLNESKANKSVMALNKEREELILALNRTIEDQKAEISSLQSEKNAKIISFKEDLEIIQREYIAKLELIRNKSGQKISLLEMENITLAETLKKEKSKPKELIIFKAIEEETLNNQKTNNLLEAMQRDDKQNNQPTAPQKAVNIPSMAEALKHYGANESKDAIKMSTPTNATSNFDGLDLIQTY